MNFFSEVKETLVNGSDDNRDNLRDIENELERETVGNLESVHGLSEPIAETKLMTDGGSDTNKNNSTNNEEEIGKTECDSASISQNKSTLNSSQPSDDISGIINRVSDVASTAASKTSKVVYDTATYIPRESKHQFQNLTGTNHSLEQNEEISQARRNFMKGMASIATVGIGAKGASEATSGNNSNPEPEPVNPGNSTEPTPTDTPEPNDEEEVSYDRDNFGLNLNGENIFEYQGESYSEGTGIKVGEPIEIDCEIPDKVEEIDLEFENESLEAECGEPVVFDEEGEYTVSMEIPGDNGSKEETIVAVEPPEIVVEDVPGEITEEIQTPLVYDTEGTDVELTHEVRFPDGNVGNFRGEVVQLEPEQKGTIEIETTAKNQVGEETMTREVEVTTNYRKLQERNLDKRQEVASSIPDDYSAFTFYDTEIFRELLDEEEWTYIPEKQVGDAEKPSITPNLEYMAEGNMPDVASFLVKSYSEIDEDKTPSELHKNVDYSQVDEYRGTEVYKIGWTNQYRVCIDRENGYLFSAYHEEDEPQYKSLIDRWRDGARGWNDNENKEGDSYLNDSLWYEDENNFDDLIVAEALGKTLETAHLSDEDKHHHVQRVGTRNNEVTEEIYDRVDQGKGANNFDLELIKEKTGINLEGLVDDLGDVAFSYN